MINQLVMLLSSVILITNINNLLLSVKIIYSLNGILTCIHRPYILLISLMNHAIKLLIIIPYFNSSLFTSY